MMLRIRYFLPILLALLVAGQLQAASTGGEEEDSNPDGLSYVDLGAPFVTNYDGGGRLKYLKTQVSLRVRPPANDAVQQHMPYLRNELVMLFSRQLEEDLTSTQGKEELREQALELIRDALDNLASPEAAANVQNLYFTAFVVQS